MKKLILNLMFILCLVSVAHSGDSIDLQAFIKQANSAFTAASEMAKSNPVGAEKEYQRAALLFNKVISSGIKNEKIYYNLGNCYYRLGSYPKAILEYQRGLQYDSTNDMILNNLAAARLKAGLGASEENKDHIFSSIVAYQDRVSISLKEYVFYGSYSLFWILLVVMLVLRKRMYKKIFIPMLAIWVLALGAIAVFSYSLNNCKTGVILSEAVGGRRGDGENYTLAFKEPLKAGMEFKLVEKRGEWAHIELADGQGCWVKKKQVGFVCE